MALARWEPFRELPLRDAMGRLFENSLVRPGGWGTSGADLPLDVYLEGESYVLELGLPGMNPDAVDISVLGNQVTICGEVPEPQGAQQQGRQYLLRERGSGRFERTVTLPAELEADKAQAHYEQGLLRLTIPKAQSARARRIQIGSGSTQRR
jgi:HSP20 family protein